MKKMFLFLVVIFAIGIITPALILAYDDSDRQIGCWIEETQESVRSKNDCWLKEVTNEVFMENNFPETTVEIRKNIEDGNFNEARKIADIKAEELAWGYDPCLNGDQLFETEKNIEKEVVKVFRSKDLEKKKVFILKNSFNDIGIKNYKKISSEKNFIFSEEVQTKIKNKLDGLKEVKEKEKFKKKLIKYGLLMEE